MLPAAAGQVTINVLASVAEMDAIGPEWLALENLSDDPLTYFQSYGWCRAWSNREVALRAHAAPFSVAGRVYAGTWLPTLRPRIKRLYRVIPDLLRRSLAIGQGFSYLLFYV